MRSTTSIKIKSLPVYVGIIAPLLVLVSGVLLINKVRSLSSSANTDKQPTQIKVGNITDHGFTLTWLTTKPASGFIIYGSDSNRQETIVKDIRDINKDNPGNYINHFVTLENLTAETEYYYKIVSSEVVFDNNGQPYQVKTATKITPSDSDISQGRVINSDNSPAAGVLIYLTLANTSPLLGITDDTGRWMIPTSTARSIDLRSSSNYDRMFQIIDLVALLGDRTSSIILSTKNDNPAPDIILGQNANYTNLLSNTEPKSGSGSAVGQDTGELSIIYPTDSEQVSNQIPEFIGTGPAGADLEIIINSAQTIKSQTKAGGDRTWRWSPAAPLALGEHTITVSYTDKDGFVKKVTKSFLVTSAQAADNSFLPSFTATGSGQQTTSAITQIPTAPVTTLSATVTPTVPSTTIIPTPTTASGVTPPLTPTVTPATITLTATPSPIERTTVPDSTTDVPTSGNWLTTLAVGGGGLIVVVVGLALLVF